MARRFIILSLQNENSEPVRVILEKGDKRGKLFSPCLNALNFAFRQGRRESDRGDDDSVDGCRFLTSNCDEDVKIKNKKMIFGNLKKMNQM